MNDSTASPSASPEPWKTARRPAFGHSLGPGLVIGASDDRPSGLATSSQVGAQFGFGRLWTLLFSSPRMTSAQEISARIGRVTGHGLAGTTRRHFPAGVLYAVTLVLVVVPTLHPGADIGAMDAALLDAALFARLSAGLPVVVPYARDLRALKWLTVRLFASVVRVPWGEALRATVWPRLAPGTGGLKGLLVVPDTTISPYLFFWQASREVRAHAGEAQLRRALDQAEAPELRLRIDTFLGLACPNLVAFFIILTAPITLHASGRTDIQMAAQVAEALSPVAGRLAFSLFALGIIGAGLLAVPVLAGGAGAPPPHRARLFWGAGGRDAAGLRSPPGAGPGGDHQRVVAAPVMARTMLLAIRRDGLGRFTLPPRLQVLCWLTATVRLLVAPGLFVTWGR
ncbi:NRAMP family divalent metal transporter [Deinococcus planocerae]|uniref:NRAMP family divalent metal transporter n=1 Tax=Deinococcus planocerae TaxID=1737569 RepID=UPI001C63E920|nr:divalent metal cation transporter [Deinococcus planocerae]